MPAGTGVVNGLGVEFLARAALGGEQNRRVCDRRFLASAFTARTFSPSATMESKVYRVEFTLFTRCSTCRLRRS